MATDNKFNLFDVVRFKDADWWVTGLRARAGYDGLDWVYQLTKPVYSDVKAGGHGWLGGRMDVDTASDVKEHDILGGGDAGRLQLERLREQKDAMLATIAQLEQREMALRAASPS